MNGLALALLGALICAGCTGPGLEPPGNGENRGPRGSDAGTSPSSGSGSGGSGGSSAGTSGDAGKSPPDHAGDDEDAGVLPEDPEP